VPAAGAERGELPGDLAAAAHDHERHEPGQADQRVGARVAGVGTSCTASAGTPLAASAGAITCSTRACALPSAAAPVRRTAALRALSTCDATSTVTLGRASNTAPITPTGTRRS
jgi:hypothetical protein